MTNVNYKVTGGLSENQLAILHSKITEVLETVGMQITNHKILDLLKGRPGFTINGERVCINKGLIEECVAETRNRCNETKKNGDWQLDILSGYPQYVADWKTGKVIPMLERDLIEMTRLVDVLHERGVRGSTPGSPQDIPVEIRDIHTFRIGAENCREGGLLPFSRPEVSEWIYRLMEVTGQEFKFEVFALNPLRLEGNSLDVLLDLRDKIKHIFVGCMPIMGISAPIHVMGAYVIALASAWGTYAIVRDVTRFNNIDIGCRIWPVNMNSLDIVYGTPDMVLSDLVRKQLGEFYGWRVENNCKAFHSSTPVPDQQASAQRGAYGMAMALSGERRYQFGGLLGVDMVFSPVQLLQDLELINYYKHVVKGFEFSENSLSINAIKEVGPTGSFITHDTTLENFREILWQPDFWPKVPHLCSQMEGEIDFEARAREEIEALLKKHNFCLSTEKKREIDRICRMAEASLLNK